MKLKHIITFAVILSVSTVVKPELSGGEFLPSVKSVEEQIQDLQKEKNSLLEQLNKPNTPVIVTVQSEPVVPSNNTTPSTESVSPQAQDVTPSTSAPVQEIPTETSNSAQFTQGECKAETDPENAAQYWTKNPDIKTASKEQEGVSSSMMQSALTGLAYLVSMPTADKDAYLFGYATADTALNISAKVAVVAAVYGTYKLYQKIKQHMEEDLEKTQEDSRTPEKLRPAPFRLV